MNTLAENIRELNSKNKTLVRLENVIAFLNDCKVLGVVAIAGAINDDVTAQWFYI